MKRFLVVIFVFLLIISTAYFSQAEELPYYIFLQPVCDKEGPLSQLKDGRDYPLLEEIPPESENIEVIKSLLSGGICRTSLRLDRLVKNFMINQIRNGVKDERRGEVFSEPLYICLMKGGNRPKCGFFLKREVEILDKTDIYYIEMPPEPLNFEKIFSHEHGHLLDFYIINYSFPYSLERQVHTISAVTDYEIAFLEGWGEHFEAMTVDMSENKEFKDLYNSNDLKGKTYFFYLQDMMTIAQSFKRYSWVKGNLFAFKRNPVLMDGLTEEDFEKNFFYNWMNCNFIMGELKNGQQMLSCEGVLSHIFYQIATDEILKNNFEDEEFYEDFFSDEVEDISPLENIYLKMLYVKYYQFKDYEKDKPLVAGPLFLDFIKKYIELFPEDKEDLIQIFSLSTFFTTSLKDSQEIYREAYLNSHLITYDMENTYGNFKDLFEATKTRFQKIKDNIPYSLYENTGPVLWIENDKFSLPSFGQVQENFSINLNAAEEFELLTIPGITVDEARNFVEYREKIGYFSHIEDIKKSNILTEEKLGEILRMRELFINKCKSL